MISPVLIENIKFGTYVLWCATNFSFISLIYFFSRSQSSLKSHQIKAKTISNSNTVLETSNAALQDIDDLFKTSRTWVIGTSSRRKLRDIVTARQAPEKGNREELHFEADKSRVVIIEGNGAGSLMNDNPEAHLQGIIEESDIIRRISEQVCLLKRGSL